MYQGPKLTFFGRRQLVTEIFFSVAIWKNVVAKKCQYNVFFAAKHNPKFLVATGLPAKYLQSAMSSGIKPVLKSSFDHFDRSTFPLFDTQRISKSSPNFFADVPSLEHGGKASH